MKVKFTDSRGGEYEGKLVGEWHTAEGMDMYIIAPFGHALSEPQPPFEKKPSAYYGYVALVPASEAEMIR